MKVIVCFDETRITVPCGNGDLIVKDLVNEAISRYKRATGKGPKVKICVHTVKSVNDGGILDFNDQIAAVVDDREQIVAVFEEDSDELETLLASDGMSAGSSSTDTWRPDSENSELDLRGPKPTPLNQNQRWHLKRSGLLNDDQNGIEIKEEDVNVKSGLALSVRRGSESALENAKDQEEIRVPTNQCLSKRWSTAATVHYGHENGRGKIIIPLPPSGNLQRVDSSPSDLSRGNHSSDMPKTVKSHKSTAPSLLETAEEETVVALVPRQGEPLGLHLMPARDTIGLRIHGIDKDSVAEQCGQLHLTDCIIDVNGERVDDLHFDRAQSILRKAVTTAQGSAVKIRVSSAVAQVAAPTSTNSSSPTISADEQQQELSQQQEAQLESRRKRTPPPLPPKPKLPYDLEAMLLRANNEASMDYTPDAVSGSNGESDNLYTYGSFRRPGRKLTIDLLKGPEGLGFTVTTRDNSAGVICPIYVKSILPKGAAFKDGRLKTGDRLIEVNGLDLTGKTQDEVVSFLRGISLNTEVILMVGRPEATSSPLLPRTLSTAAEPLQTENKDEALEKNKEIITYEILLNETGSAGLGVRVKGKAKTIDGLEYDEGIFVMNVINGGAAAKDGRLKPDDQLISVNGVSLLNEDNVKAMELLRHTMQLHGVSSPFMTITIAREIPARDKSAILSEVVPHSSSNELSHIIRVPSRLNLSSSPTSDPSPPKPPRLYQNSSSLTSVTTTGCKADPVLIEGDDGYAESTPNSTSSTNGNTRRRLDELKDPYDADSSMDYDPFNRDSITRQSMSEKRRGHIDPRQLETYRKSKQALLESRVTATSYTPSPSHPTENEANTLRRANSLESVVNGATAPAGPNGARRKAKNISNRNRGCNESFRVAVDRSYEAESGEELREERMESAISSPNISKEEIEVLDSGQNTSTDSANKKSAKKAGFFRGLLRRSGKEKSPQDTVAPVPEEVGSGSKVPNKGMEVAKARQAALEEQQRINVHLQRYKTEMQMQRQKSQQPYPASSSDVRQPPKRSQPVAMEQRPTIVHVPVQGRNNVKHPGIPMSGSATYVTNDPYGHYMNYDEIQKVLRRKPQIAHPVQKQRPVSNFFEYGSPPPSVPLHSNAPSHTVRMGNGLYAQTTRQLGQIREQERTPMNNGGRPSENIYGYGGRRVVAKPIMSPSAAALMGSQV